MSKKINPNDLQKAVRYELNKMLDDLTEINLIKANAEELYDERIRLISAHVKQKDKIKALRSVLIELHAWVIKHVSDKMLPSTKLLNKIRDALGE